MFNRVTFPYILVFLAAIVAANLSVAYFGVQGVFVNAFLFIGLDFVVRDILHEQWGKNKISYMAILIGMGALISYLLNQASAQIGIASFSAFLLASIADTFTYTAIRQKWILKSNASNIVASLVDSIVFPTIAFGSLMPMVVAGQFLSKVAGGLFWSLVLRKTVESRIVDTAKN